jgi:hypothetical protein
MIGVSDTPPHHEKPEHIVRHWAKLMANVQHAFDHEDWVATHNAATDIYWFVVSNGPTCLDKPALLARLNKITQELTECVAAHISTLRN